MKTWIAAGVGGFVVGKLHSGRKLRTLKKSHAKEQKKLYTQYYNDVYKMQEQINEYAYAAEHYKSVAVQVQESAELDAMQRDYDEFKQPDIDGDDRISRAEFNMYVKNYLSSYPGLAEKDYPKFEVRDGWRLGGGLERSDSKSCKLTTFHLSLRSSPFHPSSQDFDHDRDGYVSFGEYSQQMALQVQQAEWEQYYGQNGQGGTGGGNANQANALKGLLGETKKAQNFNDLYQGYR